MLPDSGNAAVNWESFLNQVVQGGIDVARIKYLGVPTADRRTPDQADRYYGDDKVGAATGLPVLGWVLIGVAVIGGGFVLYRLLK